MTPRLPPVFYHIFRHPLPYKETLALQEEIYNIQNAQRKAALAEGQDESEGSKEHPDILLILQHRPVFTAGRRQVGPEVLEEEERLKKTGADFVKADRGGQFTYHGPGQIVGYPLIDLARGRFHTPRTGAVRLTSSKHLTAMTVGDYVCNLEKLLKSYLYTHGIITAPVQEHTGVFVNPQTKLASIGVHVRHRLTTHGFSVNVAREPLQWFDKVVACGLTDVKAGCIEDYRSMASVWEGPLDMQAEMIKVMKNFGTQMNRDMVKLRTEKMGLIGEKIRELDQVSRSLDVPKKVPQKGS